MMLSQKITSPPAEPEKKPETKAESAPAEPAAEPPAPNGQPAPTEPPVEPPAPAPAAPENDISEKAEVSGRGISLKYDDADLFDFIDVVSRVLNLNYILDPQVGGRVNINMNKPVPKEALFSIFIDILRINGATIVKSGDLYHIVPIPEGKKYPSEIQKIDATTPMEGNELSTYVIPIQFMPTEDLTRILEEFKTDKTQIINYQTNNILIITDFRDNMKKLLNIVQILDNGFFEVNKVELIPIKFNKAEDVAKDLQIVFNAGGSASGIKFIPVPRMNSILTVCRSAKSLEEVYHWVDKLDAPSSHGAETFVYKVENTTATNIAEILSQLFSDMGATTTSVGGGQKTISTAEGGQPDRAPIPQGGQTIAPQLKGTMKGAEGGPIQGLSGNVKIITDELNNNLIIQGTQSDYEFLLRTIKKLDVLPRQVLVEAKVIRVDLSGALTWGVGAWLRKRQDAYPPTTGDIHFTGEGTKGLNLSTVTVFGLGNAREITMVLNTLETMSKVQILEAPSVLVLDGNEASINVGKEIPIASSTFTNPYLNSNTSQTDQYNITNTQIQYRATGVNLSVAPRISATGIVTLEIAAEVSSPGNKDEGLGGSPPINRAVVNTTMVIADGASVVLAGLISEQTENTRSALPFIGRVPLLGWLFSATSNNKNRSELLVILTPHVVHTTENAVLTTDAVISSLKSINKYITDKRRQGEFGIFTSDKAKKPESVNPATPVSPAETSPETAYPDERPPMDNHLPPASEQPPPAAPAKDQSVQPPPAKGTASPPPAKGTASPPSAKGTASPPPAKETVSPPPAKGTAPPPPAKETAPPPAKETVPPPPKTEENPPPKT